MPPPPASPADRWPYLVAAALIAGTGALAAAPRAERWGAFGSHRIARPPQAGEVSGSLRKWQRVSITFSHDRITSEADPDNPFRNYRLFVDMTHPASGATVRVPGFYAADGNAAETSAAEGDRWRVHFVPDREGEWLYLASFRSGPDIAVELEPDAGSPASFDGASGSFVVGPPALHAPGFLGKGPLRWTGERFLRFAETNERFLKGGADSPENSLAYYEFDGTWDRGGLSTPGLIDGLHRFAPHAAHFDPRDPYDSLASWQGGRGENLLGAVNYLAEQGVNSIYFVIYNIDGGDGEDTWVWTDPDDPAKDRFDVSKLDQWERVFAHLDARGLQLHLVTQETENDLVMGGLTFTRKIYYRELVARFAHHLALMWNLGEENDNSDAERMAFAQYIRSLDPYDHPITVHTRFNRADTFYDGLLGDPSFEATSIQGEGDSYNRWAIDLGKRSADSGRQWSIFGDEQAPPVAADMANLDVLRRGALWGNLCGGGAGVEWFFGYQGTFGDLQSEDFTVAQPLWEETRMALELFRFLLPLSEMLPDNVLTLEDDDYVLAKPGEIYLVYRRDGGGATLDLGSSPATFTVRWYDPRTGGALRAGVTPQITGPGLASIGPPPASGDWAALVRREDTIPSCQLANTLELRDESFDSYATVSACDSVSAERVTVAVSGKVTLQAGQRIAFGDGFAVARGGELRAVLHPLLGE